MGSLDLAALREQARRLGWAVGSGNLMSVQREARRLGWNDLAIRSGDAAVSQLRPTERAAARPRSLSAQYGLGAQPLHTDGAHHRTPPDVVLLLADTALRTPTLLWKPTARRPNYVVDGVFVVDEGTSSFLSSAYDYSRGWRFDPGCMRPCDQRARETVTYFENALDDVTAHEWSAGDVVVLDNRHALHARAQVADGEEEDRVITRIAFYTGGGA